MHPERCPQAALSRRGNQRMLLDVLRDLRGRLFPTISTHSLPGGRFCLCLHSNTLLV
jgi:hypothetical protein